MAEFDHLSVVGYTESKAFKSMHSVIRGAPPARDRISHGQRLLQQLSIMSQQAEELAQYRDALQLPQQGMAIALEISPKGFLDYKQLEWRRDGIEVLNVTEGTDADLVVLFVPDGAIGALEKRIAEYLQEDTKRGDPKNAALVNVIQSIRRAAFVELWTDSAPLPAAQTHQWFQLWLRQLPEGPAATYAHFVGSAQRFEIHVEEGFVRFPGRVVVAAYASRAAVEQAIELLDCLAEIRSVAPTADFFLSNLTPAEQADWVGNLRARTTYSQGDDLSYVTLLDTGVNHGHPLIAPALDGVDMHAVHPTWSHVDQQGHGTQMAGLILHGNLVDPLASTLAYAVGHRLESVKLLPDAGQTPVHLYGWVTQLAAERVEQPHADRRRVFAMMSTSIGQTTGTPSEWSATVDHLAFGAVEEDKESNEAQSTPRLFVLSAGNVAWPQWTGYPNVNITTSIENPAQAWNALTVGACTFLDGFDNAKYASFKAIAPVGALAPASSTSLMWRPQWPYKPDVVAEGGNGCLDGGVHVIVGPEAIRLLTTSHNMTTALLTEAGDTSAATAEVSRLCATIATRYPGYWPETVRALVVHGARYTRTMRASLPIVPLMQHKINLLRQYGFGAIDWTSSLDSFARRPTLVLQEKIKPYRLEKGDIKLNHINLHAFPWPAAELQSLGETAVALRVTLSYFVEPNPGQRGWQSRFRYQSHGLRFAVKGATESVDRFNQRINKIDRLNAAIGADVESMSDPDSAGWFLGTRLRSRGSIHSDVWMGTAAQLAEKSQIAVYPVGGWWKDWKGAGLHSKSVRYALIVTLDVLQDLQVDLYTPIQTQIGIPVEVLVPEQS
ncbi:subtilase family protein [Tahibacter aquaticus]|uniref:Subtilase family protein n=1 Tax=Tahibacter aquaticus TaxID=520092 RepID=A0A4R6Z6J3_9GAMM|nr:S8 family peptidase [Tahibacter aquaticus]TDR47365.1 subtilase family protein [Tahibacter aquaticus]